MNLPLWLAIFAIGVITFAYRLSFILLFEKVGLPIWLRRALRFVPIAALSAIIAPEIMIQNNAIDFSLFNARLIAGLIASIAALKTRNVFATIAIGMFALWAVQMILG
jgi:branched-subunit amino acid transport protein